MRFRLKYRTFPYSPEDAAFILPLIFRLVILSYSITHPLSNSPFWYNFIFPILFYFAFKGGKFRLSEQLIILYTRGISMQFLPKSQKCSAGVSYSCQGSVWLFCTSTDEFCKFGYLFSPSKKQRAIILWSFFIKKFTKSFAEKIIAIVTNTSYH